MNSSPDPEQKRWLEEQRREAESGLTDQLAKQAREYREAEEWDDNLPHLGEGEGRVLLTGICVVMGIVLLLALAF